MKKKISGWGAFLLDNRFLLALIFIFLLGFYIRIYPFSQNPHVPYGRSDAAFHYQLARMVSKGMSMNGCDNCFYYHIFFGEYIYPPFTHYSTGLISRFSGIDIQYIIYPFTALMSSLLILSIFLLTNRLYGVIPALASSIFILFSFRDIQSMLWGQWPSIYSLGFIPLALYFLVSLNDGKKNVYGLFATTGLLFLIYPQSAITVILVSILYLSISGFPKVSKKVLRNSVIIFLVISLPTLVNLQNYKSQIDAEPKKDGFSTRDLFWYPDYKGGYPDDWYSIKGNYFSGFIVLALTGFFIHAFNFRSKESKLALIFLIVHYLLTHLFILGVSSPERSVRAINQEPILFSLFFAGCFSKGVKKAMLKKLIVAGFVLLLVQYSYSFLVSEKSIFSSIQMFSVTQVPSLEEINVFNWISENTTENSKIVLFGGDSAITVPWGTALTQRQFLITRNNEYFFGEYHTDAPFRTNTYLLLDLDLPNVEKANAIAKKIVQLNDDLAQSTKVVYRSEKIILRKY